MRKILVAVATAIAMLLPVGVAAPAVADTPGCVHHAEWQKAEFHTPKGEVHAIFDTNGWQWHQSWPEEIRAYDQCGTNNTLFVHYVDFGAKWRLVDKWGWQS